MKSWGYVLEVSNLRSLTCARPGSRGDPGVEWGRDVKWRAKTSNGAWVPIPWTRSADSRQITPCGTRSTTSASERCSLTALPGSPYTPRATRSSFPAATNRLSTTVGTACCARSRARSSGRLAASARTACSCVEGDPSFTMRVCFNL